MATWTCYPNRTNGQSLTQGQRQSYMLYDLVNNILIGNHGWTAIRSCYYYASDSECSIKNGNQWTSYDVIRNDTIGGGQHPWIVLEDRDEHQYCIVVGLDGWGTTSDSSFTIGVSQATGYTLPPEGSYVSTLPTAEDAIWTTTDGNPAGNSGSRWNNSDSDDDPYIFWAHDKDGFFITAHDLSTSGATGSFIGAVRLGKVDADEKLPFIVTWKPNATINEFNASNCLSRNHSDTTETRMISFHSSGIIVSEAEWYFPRLQSQTTPLDFLEHKSGTSGGGNYALWEIQIIDTGAGIAKSSAYIRRGILPFIYNFAGDPLGAHEGDLMDNKNWAIIGTQAAIVIKWDGTSNWT